MREAVICSRTKRTTKLCHTPDVADSISHFAGFVKSFLEKCSARRLDFPLKFCLIVGKTVPRDPGNALRPFPVSRSLCRGRSRARSGLSNSRRLDFPLKFCLIVEKTVPRDPGKALRPFPVSRSLCRGRSRARSGLSNSRRLIPRRHDSGPEPGIMPRSFFVFAVWKESGIHDDGKTAATPPFA